MKNARQNQFTEPLKSPILHNFNSMLQKQRNMLIPKRKIATFNWTLFVLFILLFIRYYNTREVATHKIRNTVTQGEGYDRKAQQWNEEKHSVCIHQKSARLSSCSSLPFQD